MSQLQESETRDKIFEHALLMLQTEANNFAYMFIKDARLRSQYSSGIKTMSNELLDDVKSGRISAMSGAQQANYLRNELMDVVRRRSHPILLAYARSLKLNSVGKNDILEKKSMDLFKKSFSALTAAEVDAVYLEAIAASGRSRESVNRLAAIYGRAGKGLFVLSLAIALYEIYEADNRMRETAKQSAIVGSSIAGGVALGAASVAAGICAATAPICVTVASIAGAIAGGLGMEYAFNGIF